jgi:hypothetical protein
MLVRINEMAPSSVDLLILGAGWTSNYLIPQLESEGIKFAATTTDGRNGTIPFKFDPESQDVTPFNQLPDAQTVLITFPLKGTGQSSRLTRLYVQSRTSGDIVPGSTRFIQFGVSSIWTAQHWNDDNSPYNKEDPRAIAEDELLERSGVPAAVLSLAGLYGGARQPRNWVDRVIRTKEDLRAKGALHVIHGEDVARAVVALHRHFTHGKRWLLCDMHVYDWWDLVQDWALLGQREEREKEWERTTERDDLVKRNERMLQWVGELMIEEGVKALPRDASAIGRALDGRGFWNEMGIWPSQGRIR